MPWSSVWRGPLTRRNKPRKAYWRMAKELKNRFACFPVWQKVLVFQLPEKVPLSQKLYIYATELK